MALAPLLSAATMLLSLAFGALVLARWRAARKRHQLLWGASLLLFALASGLELLAALQGWGEAGYKLYFVATATMVALMASGTGHLVSRNLGGAFLAYLFIVSLWLSVFTLFAAADPARLAEANASGAVPTKVLGSIGFLHAMLDVPSALFLVVSPLLNWRATRAAYTLLIAAGALVFTAVHTLASGAQTGVLALDSATLFGAGTLTGLLLMFAGYLRSRETPQARREAAQAVAASG